jgi:hypothetical protein
MIIIDQKSNGLRRWKVQFDNLDEVQRWITQTPRKCCGDASKALGRGSSWDLNAGWEGALHMARHGWLDGVTDMSDKLALKPPHTDSEPSWRYDVAGEMPDIGRFLAGDPAHMKRHGHPKGHRPVITLAIGANAVASVSARQMANYGAAMVAVIDQLESTGRRVEAHATFVSTGSGSRICPVWCVKRAEDSLDLSALAFSLAHPAAFRRLGFAIYERSDLGWMHYGGSVGSTLEDLIDPAPNTLVVSGLADGVGARNCDTLDGAIKFAAEQINKAAGEELVTISA